MKSFFFKLTLILFFTLISTFRVQSQIDFHQISFDELVKIMIDADMRVINLEPPGEGDKIIESIFPEKWWHGD